MDDITDAGARGIRITTLAERPELAARLWDMKDSWPEFAQHDALAWLLYPRMVAEFPEYVLIATDGDAVVARGFSVPFAQHAPGRDGALPAQGWDRILMWAFSDQRRGVEADTVSAIEISVATDRQGEGLSGRMLAAMRETARARGFAEVVAPVRPSGKPAEPDTSIHAYAYRIREDDLRSVDRRRGAPEFARVTDDLSDNQAEVAEVQHDLSESRTCSGGREGRRRTGVTCQTCQGNLGGNLPASAGRELQVEPNVWVRRELDPVS